MRSVRSSPGFKAITVMQRQMMDIMAAMICNTKAVPRVVEAKLGDRTKSRTTISLKPRVAITPKRVAIAVT